MRLDNDDAKKFPNFKKYLENDFAGLTRNKDIMDAVINAGNFKDRDKAKNFFIFGHHPKLNIAGGGSDRAQFKQFPAEIPLRLNLVQGFENKDKLDGNNKFMTELVFFPTGHGHRILQVGLKLIELVIEGNLVVFSDSNPDNDERRNIIKEFEKLAYGGVDKSGALFP